MKQHLMDVFIYCLIGYYNYSLLFVVKSLNKTIKSTIIDEGDFELYVKSEYY